MSGVVTVVAGGVDFVTLVGRKKKRKMYWRVLNLKWISFSSTFSSRKKTEHLK
jgi:hypothetical protein